MATVGNSAGWERLGKLSDILQAFRHLYVVGEADDGSTAIVDWRRELRQFLRTLIHRWAPGLLTLRSTSEAFGCGLMSEITRLLLEVQSELPVCTPAIVHVLLHRLATLRAGITTKGQFGALVATLQQALEACPALPASVVESAVEHCLRRPSPGVTGSTLPIFVRGVLSLVTQSPRALGPAVVPLLVRFVSETDCQTKGSAGADTAKDPPRSPPCASCVAAGARSDTSRTSGMAGPIRCDAQQNRDLVLEGLLRWVVDAHFRRCSRVLQASLLHAVCDGVRQALDAAGVEAPSVFPPSPYFPLACRLLLAFIGGLSGDGGVEVAAFYQDLCRDELRNLRTRSKSKPTAKGDLRRVDGAVAVARELPVLAGYVGHLCLCRHMSDDVVSAHFFWLARQALAIFRVVEAAETRERPASDSNECSRTEAECALRSLCYALVLSLTRPNRGRGKSTVIVPEGAGNLLHIIFDSDARPLSWLPRPLVAAAVGVLQHAGHLQLTSPEALFGPPPRRRPTPEETSGDTERGSAGRKASEDALASKSSRLYSTDGFDFRSACAAFPRSWELAEAGVDVCLPSIRNQPKLDDFSHDTLSETEESASDLENSDEEDRSSVENGWKGVPDEVALRVFSFLTPKRVCRISCVERTWRDLGGVGRLWKHFYEARWPLRILESEDDLVGLSIALLKIPKDGGPKRKRKRSSLARAFEVYHWEPLEDPNKTLPTQAWMVLYRDRHRAELAATGRCAAKTGFPWRLCPFLGCTISLKSPWAVQRHIKTHKRPQSRRRVDTNKSAVRKRQGSAAVDKRRRTSALTSG